MRLPLLLIGLLLAIVAGFSACREKPALTKPTQTVERKPTPKPDNTCHCGKPQCSDPTAWNWYVKPKRNQSDTGAWYWERDKTEWSWVFYSDAESQVPAASRPAFNQAPARRFGSSCGPRGCP